MQSSPTALPLGRLVLSNSHLYLWRPNALLLEALTIMKVWVAALVGWVSAAALCPASAGEHCCDRSGKHATTDSRRQQEWRNYFPLTSVFRAISHGAAERSTPRFGNSPFRTGGWCVGSTLTVMDKET